jgi:hypothetical protein
MKRGGKTIRKARRGKRRGKMKYIKWEENQIKMREILEEGKGRGKSKVVPIGGNGDFALRILNLGTR